MSTTIVSWYPGYVYDMDPDDEEVLAFDMTGHVLGDPISAVVVSGVGVTATLMSFTLLGVVSVRVKTTAAVGALGSVTVQVQMDAVNRRRSRTLDIRVKEA